MSVRALVLAGFGINCEGETAAALRLAGADVETVHLNRLLRGQASLREHRLLVLPGGFSFGDDLGSGRVLASKLRFTRLPSSRTLLDELERFVADGGRVLGICNGFQILVKAGLLPAGVVADPSARWQPSATLTRNDSGHFEDRWVRLRVNPRTPAAWLRGLPPFDVPVRHGEGKLVLDDDAATARVVEQGLDALHYVDPSGQPTQAYPANPNGSALGCAALCDPSGQVLGLMPHPEAFLALTNHPAWPLLRRQDPARDDRGDGLRFFSALVGACAAPTTSRDDGARAC